MQTEAQRTLEERRQRWQSKEVLRRLYHKWYSRIGEWIIPGMVLELGGGSGNLKEHFPEAISSDIVFAPWLDAVLDAQRLPMRNESVSSIVLFDVLHHLPAPALFFSEAERVLRFGGRIIMMEPYVSSSSYWVYKYFHQEGLDRTGNPLLSELRPDGRDPFQGNQAVPVLIFKDYRREFEAMYPCLQIIEEEKMDFFTYPLSGGFHHLSLCPMPIYKPLERIERFLEPLSSWLAFRVLIVLEKK